MLYIHIACPKNTGHTLILPQRSSLITSLRNTMGDVNRAEIDAELKSKARRTDGRQRKKEEY